MNGETLRWVLMWASAGVLSVWFLSSLIFRVAGEWVRLRAPEDDAGGLGEERFRLAQFGPFVSGECRVRGGRQTFQGVIVARTLYLRRRDFGQKHLERQGFPVEIARRLEGQVFARFELKLQNSGAFLEGCIYPRRIEFTHQPPKITGIYQAKPSHRAYRRVELLPSADTVDAWTEEVSAPSPRS